MRIFLNLLRRNQTMSCNRTPIFSIGGGSVNEIWSRKGYSTHSEHPELKPFLDYIDSLKNYEKLGVPKDAGTDSGTGFDLGPMTRLLERLGNPQTKFKAIHIAGTKGKGSTASFLSNILRAEGYSVGCYTSPHIQTIRERISLGRLGEPVSAQALNSLFLRTKKIIDQTMELHGSISHFEVFTALAFTLFAEENVEFAVIEAGLGGARDATNVISSSGLAASIITTIGEEHLAALGGSLESIAMAKSGIIKHGCPLVLGGPFLPHIEKILRDKACTMCSPVVSASDPGIRSAIKGLGIVDDGPIQSCDIVVQIERDFPLFIDLFDVKLRTLGSHQLQNAITATCAALCLRHQGWNISDDSIKAGLERTYLLGRSQLLTKKDAKTLGLPGATILLDGAHTKESAKALVETVRMTFPDAQLAVVVAMASDKDHLAFAREFLLGRKLEAVILTEADIAGGKSRTTSASLLRDEWIQASKELSINILHDATKEYKKLLEDQLLSSESGTILAAESSLGVSMRFANQILKRRTGNQSGVLIVTGSLHIVSLVLASLHV